ncbi:DUF421 domain-containing protein [Alteribacillus bidgolensis]|uniref:Uncharacterized membrane protein YcaP, DUF421 family n=1 Tax=Alteribacillus bidgolensis TaxID=930129 RepID=A0A1G8IJX7_9BACI|nr:DUF421 domain-containing protein [Alteribacillus bidgolensis]SDI19338.1 Uncharacterized membrane protein YcaP, DUF421 family [Alteribacillus bidgolensis]
MNFIWESVVLVLGGLLLLRVAGRKSISQMTVAQTVIMISIGSLIIQPIVETSIWKTIVSSAIFIGFLLLMEYLQVKCNAIEKLLTGKSKVVIRDGQIQYDQLKQLRFTVDQLELRLRQQGITNPADLKTATLESNGQLGFEWMPKKRPVTVGDLEQLLGKSLTEVEDPQNVFTEAATKHHPVSNNKQFK